MHFATFCTLHVDKHQLGIESHQMPVNHVLSSAAVELSSQHAMLLKDLPPDQLCICPGHNLATRSR